MATDGKRILRFDEYQEAAHHGVVRSFMHGAKGGHSTGGATTLEVGAGVQRGGGGSGASSGYEEKKIKICNPKAKLTLPLEKKSWQKRGERVRIEVTHIGGTGKKRLGT